MKLFAAIKGKDVGVVTQDADGNIKLYRAYLPKSDAKEVIAVSGDVWSEVTASAKPLGNHVGGNLADALAHAVKQLVDNQTKR